MPPSIYIVAYSNLYTNTLNAFKTMFRMSIWLSWGLCEVRVLHKHRSPGSSNRQALSLLMWRGPNNVTHHTTASPPHHGLLIHALFSQKIHKFELPITRPPMASRVLRPAFRAATAARGFQTSAVLRADAVIAPVRKPVGAFRGG